MSFRASLLRFAGLSAVSFGANLGLTVFLHEGVGVPQRGAYATALVCVFLLNFLGLRYVVYNSRKRTAPTQLLGFLMSSLAFRGTEYAVFWVLVGLGTGHYAMLITCIAVLSAGLKFLFLRRTVFRA